MTILRDGWTAEKASGWWDLYHLVHEPCGFRSGFAYDLLLDTGSFGRTQARALMACHVCEGQQ